MKKNHSIEVEGETVQDAVKKALRELKLPRDKIKIEVLCEEKRGLFGMPGAKPAKIRATVINVP
jgi:spoIIIJ-associated protein